MPLPNVIAPDLNTPEIQPKVPVAPPVIPSSPSNTEITWGLVFQKIFGKVNLQTLVLIATVLWIGFGQIRNHPYNPQPNPVPAPAPLNPGQKTLRDLVGPDAARELGNFYHAMATVLYTDKGRVENKDEKATLVNIGDFYQYHQDAMQNFQNANNITGISAINEPISIKLRVATGSLDPGKLLDDPATKVRDSVIAACHQIAIEFDDRYASVPVGKF